MIRLRYVFVVLTPLMNPITIIISNKANLTRMTRVITTVVTIDPWNGPPFYGDRLYVQSTILKIILNIPGEINIGAVANTHLHIYVVRGKGMYITSRYNVDTIITMFFDAYFVLFVLSAERISDFSV